MQFRIGYWLKGEERYWCCESFNSLTLDQALIALIRLHTAPEQLLVKPVLEEMLTEQHIAMAQELGIADVRILPPETKNPDF